RSMRPTASPTKRTTPTSGSVVTKESTGTLSGHTPVEPEQPTTPQSNTSAAPNTTVMLDSKSAPPRGKRSRADGHTCADRARLATLVWRQSVRAFGAGLGARAGCVVSGPPDTGEIVRP